MSSSTSETTTYTDKAIEWFQQYLRINTVQPDPAYKEALDHLESMAKECGLPPMERLEFEENRPIGVIRIAGKDSSLPAICFNSHTDVVPVIDAEWNTDPFAGVLDEEGWIIGRGTQDMKLVSIAQIVAMGNLLASGATFDRDVYLTFVPDEEIGGEAGMKLLVTSQEFKDMNVGCVIDEGLASGEDNPVVPVYYGERAPWWLTVRATGPTGHGSRFVENTAVEKLMRSVKHFLDYRAEQKAKLDGSSCSLGDVTTINLTALDAGVSNDGGKTYALNVIPTEASAGFDIRIDTDHDLDEFKALVEKWTEEEGVWAEFVQYTLENKTSSVDDDDHWWSKMSSVFQALDVQVKPEIFPAATDSRFIRLLDIPAYGFSYMPNTPILLHDHNEKVHKDVFLAGIPVYEELIKGLAGA